MSRELLGTDDERDGDDQTGRASWREEPTDLDGEQRFLSPPARPATPGRPVQPLRPRRLAAAGLVAGLVGMALGWADSGVSLAPTPGSENPPLVWAVAQSASPYLALPDPSADDSADSGADGSRSASTLLVDLGVQLVNRSPAPLTLVGIAPSVFAVGEIELRPLPLALGAGASGQATARIEARCWSPLPLDLPGLIVSAPDGGRQIVPVIGAAAELVAACSAFFPDSALRAVAARDGDRLTVNLWATSGRSLRVVAIEAGGVLLEAEPVPRPIDGYTSTIWLDPPDSCPTSWRQRGIPQQLDLVVEGVHGRVVGSTRARIRILIGADLGDWLLEGPCRDG